MGGIYGDKPSTLERFKANFQRLDDNVRARVVLENDEVSAATDFGAPPDTADLLQRR
jgi:UV DNA damage repair endonuclease